MKSSLRCPARLAMSHTIDAIFRQRAAERIRKHLNLDLAPEQFIVIGDTPNDIDCARHFGARAVAVGTGRFYSNEEILTHNPDEFLPDLSNTDLVLNTLHEL